MYTINAICNVKGDYRVAADESGNISQRFEYDLAGYDYNVKIIYTDGTTVRCTAADLKQITGYEPKFSQGDKVLPVGANVGYCTVGGVTAKLSVQRYRKSGKERIAVYDRRCGFAYSGK
ncbi:MAG: hypothetical protein ACLTZI_13830 [[Eubacterium] siraeum]